MEESMWVVEINEELKNNGPSVHEWERHSIYKVPLGVTALNERAYKPLVVSFGPYHNGDERLKNMEAHKRRALINFLKRCKKPIELIYHRMDQVVDDLRDSYYPPDPIWMQDKPNFLKMMIHDGCFMLEILRDDKDDLYAKKDPVFGEHGKLSVVPYIKRDMLLLENQLPLIVLRILYEVENDTNQGEEKLIELILKFLGARYKAETIKSIGKCMHILDVRRKSMIQLQELTKKTRVPQGTVIKWLCNVEKEEEKEEEEEDIFRFAKELQEAGICFKKSKSSSLRDVSFAHGELWLPRVTVDESTEYIFLNLIAFERLYVGAGNEVSDYVCFMNRIIDTPMDVAILHQNGILVNNLGSDKAVAQLFNSIGKEVNLGRGLRDVRRSLSNYYRYKPWKRWRANLLQTYFRNPWASVSLIAAFCLFALTIVQTVYTIIGYYRQDDDFERLKSTKRTFHCVWHMIFFSCHK